MGKYSHMCLGIGIAALLVLPAHSTPDNAPPDPIFTNHCAEIPPGAEAFVKTEEDALRIGFAMYRTANPKATDERAWTAAMVANLRSKDCVWEISERPTKEAPVTPFIMGIGQGDGRFLGILLGIE